MKHIFYWKWIYCKCRGKKLVTNLGAQKVTKAFPPFSVLKFLSLHFVSQQFLVFSSKRHFKDQCYEIKRYILLWSGWLVYAERKKIFFVINASENRSDTSSHILSFRRQTYSQAWNPNRICKKNAVPCFWDLLLYRWLKWRHQLRRMKFSQARF